MAIMPRLLGISPGDHGCGRTLTWIVQGAVDGGLRALILREPHLSEAAYVELARRLSPLLGPGLILHASHPKAVHIASRAGWGLHMPSTADWSGVRSQLGGWLGASCHNADDLARAVDAGCDYVTLSPVFTPFSKPSDVRPCLGLEGLDELACSIDIPVFALGGIDAENMPGVMQTGVHGVGSMGFLFPNDADADVSTENAAVLAGLLG
jgi:thiamine-phosphate pyrophosphorylase